MHFMVQGDGGTVIALQRSLVKDAVSYGHRMGTVEVCYLEVALAT